MITVKGLDVVNQQLQKYHDDLVINLTKMTERFAVHLTETASNNTPVGNKEILYKFFMRYRSRTTIPISFTKAERKYISYYVSRERQYELPVKEGYHRGAYRYSETPSFAFSPVITDPERASKIVSSEFVANFKLGDTFYVGASGPAYAVLDSGLNPQAPNGIIKPTIEEIVQAYNSNLQYFYRSN